MTNKEWILGELANGILFSHIVMTNDDISLYETPNENIIYADDYDNKEEYRLACIKFVKKHKNYLGNGSWI